MNENPTREAAPREKCRAAGGSQAAAGDTPAGAGDTPVAAEDTPAGAEDKPAGAGDSQAEGNRERDSFETEEKIEMAIPQRCQSNPRLSLMNHATNPFAHTWKTGRE